MKVGGLFILCLPCVSTVTKFDFDVEKRTTYVNVYERDKTFSMICFIF